MTRNCLVACKVLEPHRVAELAREAQRRIEAAEKDKRELLQVFLLVPAMCFNDAAPCHSTCCSLCSEPCAWRCQALQLPSQRRLQQNSCNSLLMPPIRMKQYSYPLPAYVRTWSLAIFCYLMSSTLGGASKGKSVAGRNGMTCARGHGRRGCIS